MLRRKSPTNSFFGSYLYDRIIPPDHLLRKINQVVDFSFVNDLVKDRYNPEIGRPAADPEFMLRLCLLQYLYGDSDRKVVKNAGVSTWPTSISWALLWTSKSLMTPPQVASRQHPTKGTIVWSCQG